MVEKKLEQHTHDNHLFGVLEHFKAFFDKCDSHSEPKRTSSLTWLHKEISDMRRLIEKKLDWKRCPSCECNYDETFMVKCDECGLVFCQDCIRDHNWETRDGHEEKKGG